MRKRGKKVKTCEKSIDRRGENEPYKNSAAKTSNRICVGETFWSKIWNWQFANRTPHTASCVRSIFMWRFTITPLFIHDCNGNSNRITKYIFCGYFIYFVIIYSCWCGWDRVERERESTHLSVAISFGLSGDVSRQQPFHTFDGLHIWIPLLPIRCHPDDA